VTLVVLVVLLVGVSTLLWASVGLARVLLRDVPEPAGSSLLTTTDVAVIIAAHNEQLVIAHTIRSAAALLPASNIFVVSDGSTDQTAQISTAEGATVLDLCPNRGKAGAIAAIITEFELANRFQIVMLLDADTQLAPDYFETGLPLFNDRDVVAVAGRVISLPEQPGTTLLGRIIVAHRERIYIMVQYLHKFGQAARWANAVSIVPGFASMYRSRVLQDIDIDASGLAIEDYNMTFEVHAKKLGRIAFHPRAAIALTQDPNTLHDYVSQVSRWNLGFWQTVRRHGIHKGRFWAALGLFIVELVTSSVLMLFFLPVIAALLTFAVIDGLDGGAPSVASAVVLAVPPIVVVIGVLVPDYVMTVFAAVVARAPTMLVLGLVFPLLRIIDSYLCLRALSRAYRASTSGVWKSPERRSVVQL
jgi:biofilm PGA synthesis N-glycosyltransferase PgaC